MSTISGEEMRAVLALVNSAGIYVDWFNGYTRGFTNIQYTLVQWI